MDLQLDDVSLVQDIAAGPIDVEAPSFEFSPMSMMTNERRNILPRCPAPHMLLPRVSHSRHRNVIEDADGDTPAPMPYFTTFIALNGASTSYDQANQSRAMTRCHRQCGYMNFTSQYLATDFVWAKPDRFANDTGMSIFLARLNNKVRNVPWPLDSG